jgi:hypothetical protein
VTLSDAAQGKMARRLPWLQRLRLDLLWSRGLNPFYEQYVADELLAGLAVAGRIQKLQLSGVLLSPLPACVTALTELRRFDAQFASTDRRLHLLTHLTQLRTDGYGVRIGGD